MKNLLIFIAVMLVLNLMFAIWTSKEPNDLVSAESKEFNEYTSLENEPQVQQKINSEVLIERVVVQDEKKADIQQDSAERSNSIYRDDEVVSKLLIKENGAINHKEISLVINDGKRFRQLMEEVQNPVEAIDIKVYQNTYESLAQIIELSKYSYNYGCANNACAIEVNTIEKKEANVLADLMREKTVTGPYVYGVFKHPDGRQDMRIVFSSLDTKLSE